MTLFFSDLTERDEGIFSVSSNENMLLDIIKLEVLGCAVEVRRIYGERYYLDVPQQAEILEFTPSSSHRYTLPKVLWNRTDPQTAKGGRGQKKRDSWEIIQLTQKDNSYYNVRKKDGSLLSRTLLKVEEDSIIYNRGEGEDLIIRYPSTKSSWTITKLKRDTEYLILIEAGYLLTDSSILEYRQYDGRVRMLHDGIEIRSLRIMDSGVLGFRDEENYLALNVHLNVHAGEHHTLN
ncbi:uncharacterized protein LKV04_005209 [Tautogolabrus adspersus]